MKPERISELRDIYRRELFESVLPFWLKHSLDMQRGGQFNSLNRDGSVFDTDKSMWLQSRALWMFAKLYNEVERRPLRKRRYLFTETFAIIGLAEYARATGDSSALHRAIDTYALVVDYLWDPNKLQPKVFPTTRRAKAHNVSMIMLATTQELRLVAPPAPLYARVVDDALDQIVNHFLDERAEAVYEVLDADNQRLDTVDGRRITPGHGLESAAFVLREALERADRSLIPPALKMIDYSMRRGWYGYLHRDGSLSTPLKGGMWKGFFHTPRALWLCWDLLGDMIA